MGLIDRTLGLLFGNRNIIAETAHVFRENAEAAGQRQADQISATMEQFAAEFAAARPGMFDRFMDGVNRLPRPALALGTLGLFVAAMVDPLWFSERMLGLSLVPEPLWWLLGAIVSFYFGARHQAKGQDFQRSIATTLARAPSITARIRALRDFEDTAVDDHVYQDSAPAPSRSGFGTDIGPDAARPAAITDNAALDDWRAGHG